MKRLIAALALMLTLMVPGLAQASSPPPRDEAAVRLALSNRFIAALQADQMTDMFSQMAVAMTPRMDGVSSERQEAMQRAMSAAMNQMIPALFDAMAPIYADIFTLEELTGLVAFYESDIGRSMMSKSIAAAPRVSAVVMEMMPDLMRGMADTMCKEMHCTPAQRAEMDAGMAGMGYGEAKAPAPSQGMSGAKPN